MLWVNVGNIMSQTKSYISIYFMIFHISYNKYYNTAYICLYYHISILHYIYAYIYRGYIQIFPHHPWIPKWVEGILAAVAVPYRGRLPPSRCPARFPAKSASLSRSKIVVQGLLRGCEILWGKKP